MEVVVNEVVAFIVGVVVCDVFVFLEVVEQFVVEVVGDTSMVEGCRLS